MRRKLILLGIDGGTWELIKPLRERGYLPTFQELTDQGTEGTILSTIPPNTHPAWTSIFTGTNTGKHGITDFMIRKGHSNFSVATSKDRMVDSVWRILSNFGLCSIVVNDPVTYPPEKISGIMTTGLSTPPGSQNFVYPHELKDEINRAVHSYECDIPIDFDRMVAANRDKAYEKLVEFAQKITKCSLYLARNYEWNMLAIIFTSLDRLQHFFWNDKRFIKKHYKLLDATVKDFLELEPDVNIIGVSDHGFGSLTKCFFVNNWLSSMGLLKLERSNVRSLMSSFGLTYARIGQALLRLRLYPATAKLIPDWVKNKIPTSDHERKALIQYDKSIAYALNTGGGIFINRNLVNDYQRFKRMLFDNLQEVSDEGSPIASQVYYDNEVRWGSHTSRGPDILLIPREGYEVSSQLNPSGMFGPPIATETTRTGTHRPEGIFFAYGPHIKKGYELKRNVFTWDISPTILHMLGLPIPYYMDGRVLKEMFRRGTKPDTSPVRLQKYRRFTTEKFSRKLLTQEETKNRTP
jgi:predicted AlkP superfamily phosphohydrolase/phosphomutase